MFKMTEIELELISDIKMHLFIGKGSISYIAIRYSKANNKYMTIMTVVKKIYSSFI